MRFKIEYLTETTVQASVCHVKFARSETLEGTNEEAWAFKATAQRLFGARGFQIRDSAQSARIVASRSFE